MASPWVAVTALALLTTLGAVSCAPFSIPQNWPLQGQNFPPPGDETLVVQVDLHLESVRAINNAENTWEGVHYIHLQWEDPSATPAIQNATQRWAQALANPQPGDGPFKGCALPCDSSGHVMGGCCDDVFLPHLDLPNLYDVSQDVINKWRVWLEPVSTTTAQGPEFSTLVHWTVRIAATWHSPFDFRAWPLEHQHLLVLLQVPPTLASRLQLVFGNATMLTDTPHTKGSMVPGWEVVKTTLRLFTSQECFNRDDTRSRLWSIDPKNNYTVQPAWLEPGDWKAPIDLQDVEITDAECSPVLAGAVANSKVQEIGGWVWGVTRWRSTATSESNSMYTPNVMVVDIMVRRPRAYYILAFILPLIIIDYMVLVVYGMAINDLEARMGVVVTMVLSLTALQFTYNFPPANYLNTVQQISLMSYVLFGLVALESVFVSQLSGLHNRRRVLSRKLVKDITGVRRVNTDASSLNLGSSFAPRVSSTPFYNANKSVDLNNMNSTGMSPLVEEGIEEAAVARVIVAPGNNRTSTSAPDTAPQHDARVKHAGATAPPGSRAYTPVSGQAPLGATAIDIRPAPEDGAGGPFSTAAVHAGVINNSNNASTTSPTPLLPGGSRSHLQEGGSAASAGGISMVNMSGAVTMQPPLNMMISQQNPMHSVRSRGQPLGEGLEAGGGSNNHNNNAAGAYAPAPADNSSGTSPGTARKHLNLQQAGKAVMAAGRLSKPSLTESVKEAVANFSRQGAARVLSRVGSTIKTTRDVGKAVNEDEDYAHSIALRIDIFTAWFLVISVTCVWVTMLTVNSLVGDHRVMIAGSRPGNM